MFTYAFFIPSGVWDEPHSHIADAHLVVANGELRLGYGSSLDRDAATCLPAGSFLYIPGKAVHFDGREGHRLTRRRCRPLVHRLSGLLNKGGSAIRFANGSGCGRYCVFMNAKNPTSSTTTALLLSGIGAFQACLAAGLPWGRFAYGGQHQGRLPEKYRRISAVAAPAYIIAAVFIASKTGTPSIRQKVLSTLTGFMAIGAALNLASRSPHERFWSPVCALTAVSAWRARSH